MHPWIETVLKPKLSCDKGPGNKGGWGSALDPSLAHPPQFELKVFQSISLLVFFLPLVSLFGFQKFNQGNFVSTVLNLFFSTLALFNYIALIWHRRLLPASWVLLVSFQVYLFIQIVLTVSGLALFLALISLPPLLVGFLIGRKPSIIFAFSSFGLILGLSVWDHWGQNFWRSYKISLFEAESVTACCLLLIWSAVYIYEKKRALVEGRLQKTIDEFSALFQAMAEGIVVQDASGTILRNNHAALEILGLTQDQLLGRTSFDPRWKSIREDGSPFPGAEHPAMQALASGQIQENVLMGVFHPTGLLKWISINAVPLFEQSSSLPTGVICTFFDLTNEYNAKKNAKENESFLQSILDYSTSGIYAKDQSGKFVFVNHAFLYIFGIQGKQKIIGKRAGEIFNNEIASKFEAGNQIIFKTGQFFQKQEVFIVGEAEKAILEIRFPVTKEDGSVLFLCGMLTDVTESNKIQNELLMEKRRLDIAARTVEFGISDFYVHTKKMIWDDFNYKIFGVTREEYPNPNEAYKCLVLKSDIKKIILNYISVVRLKLKRTSLALRIKLKNSDIRLLQVESECFFTDGGDLERIVSTTWDATKEYQQRALQDIARRVDHALLTSRNQNDLIRSVLKEVTDGMNWKCASYFEMDSLSLNIISEVQPYLVENFRANRFIQKTLNLSLKLGEGLVGKVFSSGEAVLVKDLRENPLFLRLDEALDAKLTTGLLFPVRSHDRVVGVFEFYDTDETILNDSALEEFEGISMRISQYLERIESEMQLVQASKMSSLGEMSAGMAHEINNPLAIIKGKTGQLKKILSSDDVQLSLAIKHVESIDKTSDRIAKIIRSLRAFSRNADQDPFEMVFLKNLIDETLDLCTNRFEAAGVRLGVPLMKADLQLQCRSSQLSQVLLNLLNNALDVVVEMPKSQNELWVNIEVFDLGTDVEITITDCGLGIPLEVQRKIFQPFFTTKAVGKGTGLGLSISSGLIQDHGGSLTIASNCPNTRFVISLPKFQQSTKASGIALVG